MSVDMMDTRRDFLRSAAACAAGMAMGGCASRIAGGEARLPAPRFMWAYFAQFGMKMWERRAHYTELKVDESMWNSLTERAAAVGVNVFVIDLGEGLVFPSHPELAVRGSWEPERMHDEIARLKGMGIIAVPKLNFSSSHYQWLGKWRPYLSTPEYFKVCREVIRDVAEVFDESPLFHLGYDEETFPIQNANKFEYKRLRSGDLWWHDLLWFIDEVQKYGMRPWIWSDSVQFQPEAFMERMPRTVLQSNWYYGTDFNMEKASERVQRKLKAYLALEQGRYDQMPCGSTFLSRENFAMTIAYCRDIIKGDRLKGFFMAPWHGWTREDRRDKIMAALDVMEEAIKGANNPSRLG